MTETAQTPDWSAASDKPLSFLHPSELELSKDNPRQITEERFEALKYAMTKDPRFMLARPIVATPDGEVVAGHMRLRAARDLRWESVPVFVDEMDDAVKRERKLRDNVPYGDWVPSEVAALMQEHEAGGGDLAMLGFTDQERTDLQKLHEGGEAAPGDGSGGAGDLPVVHAIVIECDSDQQQADLLEEFADRDFNARAVLV